MADKLNFDNMTRNELAHYMVANRDNPEGIKARGVYIQRMAEKAKQCGIEFYRPNVMTKSAEN